jgi:hypothetical protein
MFLPRSGVVNSCMSSWPNTRSIYACFPAHSPDCVVEDNKGWGILCRFSFLLFILVTTLTVFFPATVVHTNDSLNRRTARCVAPTTSPTSPALNYPGLASVVAAAIIPNFFYDRSNLFFSFCAVSFSDSEFLKEPQVYPSM